ncbi:glycosyltransferase family A protein [Chryseolinea sp. H1M3-3]|uniref:glycosyltransferase family 2 protein n=1 Tax=Chryseolinea sp. H1M3-3 TaxID=3034144 RepID=UPI0023ED1CEC|nr:glycosyltransferase family A protein [Chryseolinea sp. H1M3-3]
MESLEENAPFFSIVVPTYNRAVRLLEAIKTILAQQYSSYEIIVVDDGSTDNTKLVISEMSEKIPSIRYFFKDNQERSIARNYGIMQARGKYVGFLDSDDVLYPNHLKVAYELLQRNSFPEVGHLGYEFVDEQGARILVRNTFDNSFKEKLIDENIIHGNAIFIRRDIATEINFIPSSSAILSEDWYVWLRLAARYPFYFDNTVTSAVVQHEARSLMNINPDKLIASTDTIVAYLKKDLPFLRAYKHKIAYHFANHYTFLTLILSLTKERRFDTIKYLLRAIRYDPTVILRKRFLASVKHFF